LAGLIAAHGQCDYFGILTDPVVVDGDAYPAEAVAAHWEQNRCRDGVELSNLRCHDRVGIADYHQGEKIGYLIATWNEEGKISGVWKGIQGQRGYAYAAELMQAADVGTTGVGLAQGLVEANPVGAAVRAPAFAVIKLALPSVVESAADFSACVNIQRGLTDVGALAAAANVVAIAGGPVVMGVVAGITAWWATDTWAANGAEVRCLPPELMR